MNCIFDFNLADAAKLNVPAEEVIHRKLCIRCLGVESGEEGRRIKCALWRSIDVATG
jgi:hypothetical protein